MAIQLNSLGYTNQYLTAAANAARKSGTVGADRFQVSASVSVSVASVEKPAEPTLDDVKKDFCEYLDSLPISAGLSGTPITVSVTEEAFERMRTDPDYMQKMKDLCKRDLCDPNWNNRAMVGAPTAIHVSITADTNNQHNSEYVASSYNSGATPSAAETSKDNFWSRRAKKRDEAEAAREKRLEEREALERFLDRMRERKDLFSVGTDVSAPVKVGSYASDSFTQPTGSVIAEG